MRSKHALAFQNLTVVLQLSYLAPYKLVPCCKKLCWVPWAESTGASEIGPGSSEHTSASRSPASDPGSFHNEELECHRHLTERPHIQCTLFCDCNLWAVTSHSAALQPSCPVDPGSTASAGFPRASTLTTH